MAKITSQAQTATRSSILVPRSAYMESCRNGTTSENPLTEAARSGRAVSPVRAVTSATYRFARCRRDSWVGPVSPHERTSSKLHQQEESRKWEEHSTIGLGRESLLNPLPVGCQESISLCAGKAFQIGPKPGALHPFNNSRRPLEDMQVGCLPKLHLATQGGQ